MIRPTAIALCLLAAGCAPRAGLDTPDIAAQPPRPTVSTASAAATRDCAGPWLEWSRTVFTSKWPYRVQVSETMR